MLLHPQLYLLPIYTLNWQILYTVKLYNMKQECLLNIIWQFKTQRPSTRRGSSCYQEKCVYISVILTVEAFWPYFFPSFTVATSTATQNAGPPGSFSWTYLQGRSFVVVVVGWVAIFPEVLGAHVVESMWSKKQVSISQRTVVRVYGKKYKHMYPTFSTGWLVPPIDYLKLIGGMVSWVVENQLMTAHYFAKPNSFSTSRMAIII